MEKLKETYEEPNVELILFEFSDIVTTSVGDNNFSDEDVDSSGGWT